MNDERKWMAVRRPKQIIMPGCRVVLMNGHTGVVHTIGTYGVPYTDYVGLILDGVGSRFECGDDFVIAISTRNAKKVTDGD